LYFQGLAHLLDSGKFKVGPKRDGKQTKRKLGPGRAMAVIEKERGILVIVTTHYRIEVGNWVDSGLVLQCSATFICSYINARANLRDSSIALVGMNGKNIDRRASSSSR
jgi:hypothetical protein